MAERTVNGKGQPHCRTCGTPFERDHHNAKDCLDCRGPEARMRRYVERQADLWGLNEGRRQRDRVADDMSAFLRPLVPIAQQLATEAGDRGITVSDVRIEAERRGLLLPPRAKNGIAAVMQWAGLTATGDYRRSQIPESHGNLHQVWVR